MKTTLSLVVCLLATGAAAAQERERLPVADAVALAPAEVAVARQRLTPSELDAAARDADRDGLTDLEEIYAGTDPGEADSDFDGLGDLAELELGTSPAREDSDGDGLGDAAELELGTDPGLADSDGDGFADDVELAAGYDPRDPADHPDGRAEAVRPRPVDATVARRIRAAITRGRYEPALDLDADGVVGEHDLELALFLSNRRNVASLERSGAGAGEAGEALPGFTDPDPCDRVAQVSFPVARFFERETDEQGNAPEFALRVLARIALADFNESGCDGDGDGVPDVLVDRDGDGVPEGLDTDGDGEPDTRERGAGKDAGGDDDCCYEPVCEWVSTVPPEADVPSESDTGLQSVDFWSYDESHRKYVYGPTHLLYSYRGDANCTSGDGSSDLSKAAKGLSYLYVNLKCAKPAGTRCERPCRECAADGAVMGTYHSTLELVSNTGFSCWPWATNRADVGAADAAAVTLCGDGKVDGENLVSGDTVTIEKSLAIGLEVGKDKDGGAVKGTAEVTFGESRVVGDGDHSGEVDVFHTKSCFPIEATITSGARIVNNSAARGNGAAKVRTSWRGMAAKATSACMPTDFVTRWVHGFDTADGQKLQSAWLKSR